MSGNRLVSEKVLECDLVSGNLESDQEFGNSLECALESGNGLVLEKSGRGGLESRHPSDLPFENGHELRNLKRGLESGNNLECPLMFEKGVELGTLQWDLMLGNGPKCDLESANSRKCVLEFGNNLESGNSLEFGNNLDSYLESGNSLECDPELGHNLECGLEFGNNLEVGNNHGSHPEFENNLEWNLKRHL